MSPRLDLPIAVACWIFGFAGLRVTGSWTPLALLAALAAGRQALGDPETRRLLRPSVGGTVLGVLGSIAMIGATYGLYRALVPLFPGLPDATRGLYGLLHAGDYRLPALGALVLLLSLCEELVWRGRPLSSAADEPGAKFFNAGALARVAAVAVLYGAATLTSGSLLLAAVATACGFGWGLLRVAGRSLWPAVLAHAAWDLAVLIFWPLA
jgi:membrane protease YdiL (CAAX protease family)